MLKEDKLKEIIENLKDGDFTDEEIQEFIKLHKAKDLEGECKCIAKKRKKLLDKVHKNEKCISCLDYLTYQIEKINK